MSQILKLKFPTDIHNIIKLYTGEACWRNGKFIHIHRIPKNDPRYTMLLNKPKIKQVYNDNFNKPIKGSVWFKSPTGKFFVINVRYGYIWNGYHYVQKEVWEMHYNQIKTICIL